MVVSHGDSATFDYAIPAKIMADAARVSHGQMQRAVASAEAPLPGDAELERRVVPLGLSAELDACLMGGVGYGELLVYLAPPCRGKTSYLWRTATNAAQVGRNVLGVTLEINGRKCWQRHYQCLTHLTNTELADARDLVVAERDRMPGKLWVHDYSYSKYTPTMLQADVEQMRAEGHDVDYIMIDYMEIMSASETVYGKGSGKHVFLGDMVTDLRRVANALNVPIITAWQINRQGADRYVFTPQDISECWEVVKIADIIIGLNQGELEQANNVMRAKVMKQREDTALPLVYLHSDLRRMIVKPLEDMDVTEDTATTALGSGDRPRNEMHSGRVVGRRKPSGSGSSG
jgi:replicative DNA helicase